MDPRSAIIDAAARLLQEQGAAALTTRGVAEAAGVQPPTLYRLFGDKDGLIDAVAEHVMATYVAAKSAPIDPDPVTDLRAAWRMHNDFGLANPELYALLNRRGPNSPATVAGIEISAAAITAIGQATTGVGVVLTAADIGGNIASAVMAPGYWRTWYGAKDYMNVINGGFTGTITDGKLTVTGSTPLSIHWTNTDNGESGDSPAS